MSGDTDPKRPQDNAVDGLAVRQARVAAVQTRDASSDANKQPPAVRYADGRRLYDTVPTPLKRLLGSPLVQTGKFAKGPNKERLIGDGWGAARSFSYDPKVNTNSRHQGLDFFAPYGETLLACADGVVVFVGFQSRKGAESVPGCHVNSAGQIVDGNEKVVANKDQIGFGGIAVHIKHTGDFSNYQTEYYHMSAITIQDGQRVVEGQAIGNIGNTGLSIGPHLHFQVAYFSGKTNALVNPTAMVPNYRPGFPDSTNSAGGAGVIMPALAPNGTQVAAGRAASSINAADRATAMQNQGPADLKQEQAQHALRSAQVTGVQQASLYAVAAGFEGKPPVVSAPMTFDFAVGIWTDGKVV